MPSLEQTLPTDVGELLELGPEDVAKAVLMHLKLQGRCDRAVNDCFSLGDFTNEATRFAKRYPQIHQKRVVALLCESWRWLEAEGLIAQFADAWRVWHYVTQLGESLDAENEWPNILAAKQLPRGLLHPTVRQDSWPLYTRGKYSGAVFSAFHAVEIAVRTKAGYGPEKYGVPLMRDAFKPNEGPLADSSALMAEQEALAHLFAGAIGSYKNPTSHRHVDVSPEESAEMIILASHLLRIVDARPSLSAGTSVAV